MANIYADLAALKSPAMLNVPDDGHDERLLALLEGAARWIDGYCDRRFGVVEAERWFDGPGKSVLAVPDLIGVSELRVRTAAGEWASWPSGHWLLYPLNAGPTEPGGRPYTRIMLTSDSIRRFPLSRAGVAVAGVWGYGDVREDLGLRVGGSAMDVDDVTVSVASAGGSVLSAGHTIRIDDEQLHVVGAVQSFDSSTATLTVRRGVNGTSAATHDVGAAVSVYRYPAAIAEACLLQAAAWWRDRATAPFAAPSRNNADEAAGVDPTARLLLEPYRRRAAALGV